MAHVKCDLVGDLLSSLIKLRVSFGIENHLGQLPPGVCTGVCNYVWWLIVGLESEGPEGATVRQTMCDWLPGLFRKPWWLPWFLYQQSCPLDHEEVLSSLESLDAPFAFQFRSGQRGFFFLGPCGRWGQWWLGKHWFYFFCIFPISGVIGNKVRCGEVGRRSSG